MQTTTRRPVLYTVTNIATGTTTLPLPLRRARKVAKNAGIPCRIERAA